MDASQKQALRAAKKVEKAAQEAKVARREESSSSELTSSEVSERDGGPRKDVTGPDADDLRSGQADADPDTSTADLGALGLPNIGMSCHMTAVVQLLAALEPFNVAVCLLFQKMMEANIKNALDRLSPSSTRTACLPPLAQLFRGQEDGAAIHEETRQAHLNALKRSLEIKIKIEAFKGWKEQDASEVLLALLSCIQSEAEVLFETAAVGCLYEPTEAHKELCVMPNPVDAFFGGAITKTLVCQACRAAKEPREEPFLAIHLPLFPADDDAPTSLQDLVCGRFVPEAVNIDCDQEGCGHNIAVAYRHCSKVPKLLLATVGRYGCVEEESLKVNSKLELSAFVSLDGRCEPKTEGPAVDLDNIGQELKSQAEWAQRARNAETGTELPQTLWLRAVLSHLGERAGGAHYITERAWAGEEWLAMDDLSVTRTSLSKVIKARGKAVYIIGYATKPAA